MYINDGLKLNKFREVRIPSNAEYFARYGFTASPDSQYSGDEDAPMPKNKTELFALMEEYDSMKQREENSKSSKSE